MVTRQSSPDAPKSRFIVPALAVALTATAGGGLWYFLAQRAGAGMAARATAETPAEPGARRMSARPPTLSDRRQGVTTRGLMYFPDSSQRLLSETEVSRLSPEEARGALAEILARHQSGVEGALANGPRLSEVEAANVRLLDAAASR